MESSGGDQLCRDLWNSEASFTASTGSNEWKKKSGMMFLKRICKKRCVRQFGDWGSVEVDMFFLGITRMDRIMKGGTGWVFYSLDM